MDDPCPRMESGSQVVDLEYGHGDIVYALRGRINDQGGIRVCDVD